MHVPPPPPGALDTSFGNGGTVITPIGDSAQAYAVVQQPDGKIVAAGGATPSLNHGANNSLAVARYNVDGTLDSAFGSGGIATVVGLEAAKAATLQPDGKVVTAGSSYKGMLLRQYCTVVRFLDNGSPDTSFGVGGVVTTQLANPDSTYPDSDCGGVALQTDGKIVVAASAARDFGKVGVIRFNADGTRDASFGTGGEVVVPTKYGPAYASAIVIQTDGKIIVGGDSFYFTDSPPNYFLGQFILARFDARGVLDTTFGQGGAVLGPAASGTFSLGAVALQPDGNIVVLVRGEVLRFLANGTPDTAFGGGGAVAGINGLAGALRLQSNGKIVIAGTVPSSPTTQSFAVWRLDANGLLDSGFGTGGSVSTALGTTSIAWAVAIQRDGQIIATGQADTASRFPGDSLPTRPNFALARYFGDPVTTSSQ